jgi:hypothetical protein
VENADDENDREVESTLDFNRWLREAAEAIQSQTRNIDRVTPPKSIVNTSRDRKLQPTSPIASSPDEHLYKPPFGPKTKAPETVSSSPPAVPLTTASNMLDTLDDFFT